MKRGDQFALVASPYSKGETVRVHQAYGIYRVVKEHEFVPDASPNRTYLYPGAFVIRGKLLGGLTERWVTVPNISSYYAKEYTGKGVVRAKSEERFNALKLLFARESRRSYWVVSPNVRNRAKSVPDWIRASIALGAAFMGWGPEKPIGARFATAIKAGDVVLIARRHRKKSQVVGFGVASGGFKRRLLGFEPPDEGNKKPGFRGMWKLRPFMTRRDVPRNLGIMSVLRHTSALRRMSPDRTGENRICNWLDQELSKVGGLGPTRQSSSSSASHGELRITGMPHNEELEFEFRTKKQTRMASRKEAILVGKYRDWLKKQGRKLLIIRYQGQLACDAYERGPHNLIEAKSSVGRGHIRMAVGQLLDYSYQARKTLGGTHKAILLPEHPGKQVEEWLLTLGIALIWERKGQFLDNAKGRFTI